MLVENICYILCTGCIKVYINPINNQKLSFMRNIIDSHTHIGDLNGKTYTKSQLDVFVKSKLPNDDVVEKMYVSNLDVLTSKKGEYEGNKQLLDNFKNSKEYELFLACSPRDGKVDNIKNLIKENPNRFIGLKFHPTLQNLDIMDSRYIPYLEFANKNKIPCLFHSAVALIDGKINPNVKDISDPESIYKLAKQYQHTPIVMAHMGAGWQESHDKTIEVLLKSIKNGDANLYADISWVDIGLEHCGNFNKNEHRSKEHILKAIKKLKGIGEKDWKYGDQSYRLMFGSDAPLDRFSNENDCLKEYTTFIDDIKFAIRNDKDLAPEADKIIDDLFYNNAKKLYSKRFNITNSKSDKYLKYSVGAILGVGLIAILFGLIQKDKIKGKKEMI